MICLRFMICVSAAVLFTLAAAAPAQQRQLAGKNIDPATIAAYEKIGGKYGGFKRDSVGDIEFLGFPAAAQAQLPGFRFFVMPKGKMPNVPVPYGLLIDYVAEDQDLKELTNLDNLVALSLARIGGVTHVTDARLKELAGLKNLATLNLSGTKVTDAGLKELAGLKNLSWLGLSDTKVTDAGLKELAGLKNLAYLELAYTKVADAGLKELSGLTNLVHLGLNGTEVSDVGLKQLAGLKNLRWLGLQFTNATATSVAELKTALPKCKIVYLPK